jgi:hypothetical protein
VLAQLCFPYDRQLKEISFTYNSIREVLSIANRLSSIRVTCQAGSNVQPEIMEIIFLRAAKHFSRVLVLVMCFSV